MLTMATHPVPLGSKVYHQALKLEITLSLTHDTYICTHSVCLLLLLSPSVLCSVLPRVYGQRVIKRGKIVNAAVNLYNRKKYRDLWRIRNSLTVLVQITETKLINVIKLPIIQQLQCSKHEPAQLLQQTVCCILSNHMHLSK